MLLLAGSLGPPRAAGAVILNELRTAERVRRRRAGLPVRGREGGVRVGRRRRRRRGRGVRGRYLRSRVRGRRRCASSRTSLLRSMRRRCFGSRCALRSGCASATRGRGSLLQLQITSAAKSCGREKGYNWCSPLMVMGDGYQVYPSVVV